MTLCLIPARSGSKRLPGKNWLTVGGKTLVQRAVDCALGAGLKPYIVTDAPERCEGLGAVVLEEPPALAGDYVQIAPVVYWVQKQFQFPIQPVVLLQPTAPLRAPEDVVGCINLHMQPSPLCVPYYTVSVRKVKLPGSSHFSYEHNGAVFVFDDPMMLGAVHMYVMPPERSVDIDTAEDLEEARRFAGG